MEETVKRRAGRPPKADAVRRRKNQTFRLRADLNERLEAAAAAKQRSISEEVEDRVSRSFERDDLAGDPTVRALADALIVTVHLSQASLGAPWGDSDFSARVAYDRIKLMLAQLMEVPPEESLEDEYDKATAGMAKFYAMIKEENYGKKHHALGGGAYKGVRKTLNADHINHINIAIEHLKEADLLPGEKEQEKKGN